MTTAMNEQQSDPGWKIISGNAEAKPLKNVTDSSLDSLQIDENRCQIMPKKFLLCRLQLVEEL